MLLHRLPYKGIVYHFCRGLSRKANPGLNHQISAIADVASDIEKNPEGFGDLESDLINVHRMHEKHELEVKQEKSRLRKYIVKSKYFRDHKYPNILTHAEKENIRLLHSKDPEQWSVEVLSESFPANCETIKKILKANWRPRSITTHDAAVFRNWEKFKKGELKLPEDLENKMTKFYYRETKAFTHSTEENCVAIRTIESCVPLSTEFSSIVSGKRKSLRPPPAKMAEQKVHGVENETFLIDKVSNKNYMRVSDIKLLNGIDASLNTENAGYEDAKSENISVTTNETTNCDNLISIHKFTNTEVEICDDDKKKFEMSRVKSRIHIPRKIRRKGATYRVDDTYYDDDGEFLYRVPGMTTVSSK
ncbi:uncharacterized protein LOC101898174 [Musca domestica]|uniref:Uncharacterized protein LOC101898174 n=1 Tax=Musca domestica TaxID=7370 RepID=A0A1I8MA60_MUSDO|nr:uncharacterized protein LOC101898174 [Musca domestica]XP_011294370.1 uncharacterized protein LOC101898174 [Musca domestica]XP_019894146.1 uncharacterized protein LOC101898174 [Musca domestica]XP_058985488.1 uncharacterized protein LOC101898174 [Musca domestica]XP_058985489.1 uncharacterized protein LOC101898174 [Musca domestica]XP_058985490.1 uncharacterized protein LOC101898174 [Musca domestica]